jgi:hypothetical protein
MSVSCRPTVYFISPEGCAQHSVRPSYRSVHIDNPLDRSIGRQDPNTTRLAFGPTCQFPVTGMLVSCQDQAAVAEDVLIPRNAPSIPSANTADSLKN